MTTQTSFSFGAMIKSGYNLFKNHAKFIILAGIATVVVQLLLQLIQNGAQMNRGGFFIELIVTLFVAFVGLVIFIGWSKTYLKISRGEGATWNTLKSEPTLWLRFIKTYLWYIAYFIGYAVATTIVFIILAIIGFATGINWLALVGSILGGVAFIVTAVYFKVRYWFINYVILDNPDMHSRDTFKHAGLLTKGSLFQLFGFMVVLGLLNLLGIICLVAGLLVTIPTGELAKAKSYGYLKEKYSA